RNKGAGHRQRLRDKFFNRGPEALTDGEILELLLTLGTPQRDCKETARGALVEFGSLPAVLEAAPSELQKIKGIGPSNSFAIHLIQAVARRYLQERCRKRNYLGSSGAAADYLIHEMCGLKKEIFKVIFLDAAHAVIDCQTLSEGTLSSNTVYPRELIKLALEQNAAALVIAHNHPSGNLTPSADDLSLTRHLLRACRLVNINLLDHLIIGAGATSFSFADQGLMTSLREECRDQP
ncbi:MAG TPA: DNA repair protein RadC, partial [Desulfurivibrionaceae bacterium]|nr:DNA repair protein RadC [Desulfurivibrionaceae bacterium]